MNRKKLKIFIASLFVIFSTACLANDLNLVINNNSGETVNVACVKASDSSDIKPFSLKVGESKAFKTDFSNKYLLTLKISDVNNNVISEFQIFNKLNYNKKYQFYVPGGGQLTGWGVAWNNNRIKIEKLNGQRNYAWLNWVPLLSPEYKADVEIEITPKVTASDYKTLEFTLFALPLDKSLDLLELDTSGCDNLKLDDKKLGFDYWGIDEYVNLDPAVYQSKKGEITRWVDLIIHNYTMKSFIFYGMDTRPENNNIELSYKEGYRKDFTVFYPPQTQLRGPGFRFNVENNDNKLLVQPADLKTKTDRDKYYLFISSQANLSDNKLDYIPIEISSGTRLGSYIKGGVKINAYEDYAYQTEFVPVNAQFTVSAVKPSDVAEKIRVPVQENGELAFKFIPMDNIKITSEDPMYDSPQKMDNRVAQKYIISGKSKSDGKTYKYRLLLIAPPFLAGNTPGKFQPGANIPDNVDIGNYIRYPLHMYLMELNEDATEVNIDGANSYTELPSDLIGGIDYFISDKDMIIKDDSE